MAMNMQPDLFIIAFHVMLIVPLLFLSVFSLCSTRVARWRASLYRVLFWDTSIRILMELYLEVVMFAMINIETEKQNSKELYVVRFSNDLAYALLSIALVAPVILFIYVWC